jgi:coenzyme PQQ biosynthesis protein PqqD
MVKLNESAGEILSACVGKRSVQEISRYLQKKYPEGEGIAEDVIDFFGAANDKGWTHFV